MSKFYVGMSGWTYEPWRGSFYPKGVTIKKELEYASRQLNSIEINGTFYSLQKPETFQRWYDSTPEDFIFAIKCPRYITHIRRLVDVEEPICNFFASGVLKLNDKTGPFLWQLPPNLHLKDDRVAKFLDLIPRDTKAAVKLAKNHSDKVKGRAFTEALGNYPLRHAIEIRHESYLVPEFFELLRQKNVAFVFAHSGLKSPYAEDLTSDFVYTRMHGQEKKYAKGYPTKFIQEWSKRCQSWAKGTNPADAKCVLKSKPKAGARDVFVYFDNEYKDSAPENAKALGKLF